MVACVGMEYDYPLRGRIGNSKVIHAAKPIKRRAYDRTNYNHETGKYEFVESVPEREEIVTACRPYTGKKYIQVDSSEEITCKNCLRNLSGYEEIKKDSFRYVLQEKASDYFYKKSGWQKVWVADFRTATMYQTEHAAASKGRKKYYKSKTGDKDISIDEYRALSQSEKQNYTYTNELDRERYVVRKIRLELE